MSYYVVAREEPLTIGNANIKYEHNERKNSTYLNREVDLTKDNYHFKKPDKSYIALFHDMVDEGLFSTRKVRMSDKNTAIGSEIIVAVAGDYFTSKEQAIEFFRVANEALNDFFSVTLPDGTRIGGEELCLSSVVHCDEGSYGLHYTTCTCVPRELKKRRTKKQMAAGAEAKTERWYFQLSHSGFWDSTKDQDGKLYYSYSRLNDIVADAYKRAGYKEIERGVKGSTAKHLHPNVYKALMNETEQKAKENIEALDVKRVAGKYVMDEKAYDNLIDLRENLSVQQQIIEKSQSLIDDQQKTVKAERYMSKKKLLEVEMEGKEYGRLKGEYNAVKESLRIKEGELIEKQMEIENQRTAIIYWEEFVNWLIKTITDILEWIEKLMDGNISKDEGVKLHKQISEACANVRYRMEAKDIIQTPGLMK